MPYYLTSVFDYLYFMWIAFKTSHIIVFLNILYFYEWSQQFQSEAWDLICMYIIVHILVWTYLFLLTSFFDCLSFCGLFLKHPYKRFFPFYILYFYQSRSLSQKQFQVYLRSRIVDEGVRTWGATGSCTCLAAGWGLTVPLAWEIILYNLCLWIRDSDTFFSSEN